MKGFRHWPWLWWKKPDPMYTPVATLPYAHGEPPGRGLLKASPDDFVVEEILGFEPSGAGEHVFLWVEKRDENTEHVARSLARLAGVPQRETGYAGLKDRQGVTRQWFSVKFPLKAEPDFSALESATVKILDMTRNARKLRKGALTGNRFIIRIRQFSGDRSALTQRLALLAARGVPNYFGSQRFGHDGGNISRVLAFFAGQLSSIDTGQRGLYLSAARSELFNRVLAARVAAGTWDQPLEGDVFMFADSHSFFRSPVDDTIRRRMAELNIHPSGPLWGNGENPVSATVAALEAAVLAEAPELTGGLERHGLEMARRPLRLCPDGLSLEFAEPDQLEIRFSLPAGAYATTLLRELLVFNDPEVNPCR